jgi:hypothetical protein
MVIQRKFAVAASMALPMLYSASSMAYTYYIDQNVNYPGNSGCPGNNTLSDDTASFASAMNSDGWTGQHWVDQNAWPQDFYESCSSSYGTGGLDSTYGDGALVSVFSGHANAGYLTYGYANNGQCAVDLHNNARLGSMYGAQSSYAIYYGCCTLKESSLVNEANWEWTNQAFGFIDAEEDGNDQLKDFYNDTSTVINKTSWLNHMESRPGWFQGSNSPMVVSYGYNQTDATYVQNQSWIRNPGVFQAPRGGGPSCGQGQPSFYYIYVFINHNNGGC